MAVIELSPLIYELPFKESRMKLSCDLWPLLYMCVHTMLQLQNQYIASMSMTQAPPPNKKKTLHNLIIIMNSICV